MSTTGRGVLRLVTILGVAMLVAGVVKIVRDWQFDDELRQAKQDFSGGRLSEARPRLAWLQGRWPGRGDVEYMLGECEMAAGHADSALAAWDRVPLRAPEGRAAALAAGRLALESLHYGLAEKRLEVARLDPGTIGEEASRLLGRLHGILGRHEAYRLSLYRELDRARDPTDTLRNLWSIDSTPYPIEGMRALFAQAHQLAREDDRVWLALADWSTRSGRFAEAAELLTRCEQARPKDRLVWEAWLDWAVAAGKPDEVLRAAKHLSASQFTEVQLTRLRAWLALQTGDQQAERIALRSLVEQSPGEAAAVERIAVLDAQAGDDRRHSELRRRKADIDAGRDRYRKLIDSANLSAHLAELARLAESIGRPLEAKAWWSLAARRDPKLEPEASRAKERITKAESPRLAGSGSLADRLGPVRLPNASSIASSVAQVVATFVDDSSERGLSFVFENGRTDLCQLPETMSGGVALVDFDSDGWVDVYAVQGGRFPPSQSRQSMGDRLFRNRGHGQFENVTASSGLTTLTGGYGFGVAVGDYDNDGRADIFVTRWRSYALYHNLGGGRFEDATARAGLGGDRDWPTSAAWADLDNDGDLDLYVCHYLKYDEVNPILCPHPQHPGRNYCDPRIFSALPDHLFRNDSGRFVDVSAQAGIVDHDGRGLGVVAADLDGDRKIDLFVANDTSANYFFHNDGDFHFTERGQESGLAANANGGYQAGMGVACADFDGDGRLDIGVTNFYGESTTLFQNLGRGAFADRTSSFGLAAPTRFVLGFGLAALDANNDGYPDLVQANGHVGDYLPATPYAMPAQLFLGEKTGKFIDTSQSAGAPWRVPRLGRGLAVGDIDNDGRVDVLIVAEESALALLHNETAPGNHFLTISLEGAGSNRDAVGATVSVTVAGKTTIGGRLGGGSYLSASDSRLHFGIGAATKADRIEVIWPSGQRDSFADLPGDTGYHLREGAGAPVPLAGFTRAMTHQTGR